MRSFSGSLAALAALAVVVAGGSSGAGVGTAEVSLGAQLPGLFADPSVTRIVLLGDVTLHSADWAGLPTLPVVLNRSLTIASPDAAHSFTLDANFVSGKARGERGWSRRRRLAP